MTDIPKDYDMPSVRVISMFDFGPNNQQTPKWHGTLLVPEGMTVEEGRRHVLKCIGAAQLANKGGWTWADVHMRLANFGFKRVTQVHVYEHEVNHNWAVMAARQKGDATLYAVVGEAEEAEHIIADLQTQGWKVAYKQPSDLMVNHVVPGSLHTD